MKLIDADKLKAHYAWWEGGTREMTMDEAKSDFDCIIDLQPTVEPTKHGRWIDKAAEDCYRCSVCEEYTHMEMPRLLYHYCPNCGARMDEVEE